MVKRESDHTLEARRRNSYTTPSYFLSELQVKIGELSPEALFHSVWLQVGTRTGEIVNIRERLSRKELESRKEALVIDFTSNSTPGLNNQTLLAVAAVMATTGNSVVVTARHNGLSDDKPFAGFSPSLSASLKDYIVTAYKDARTALSHLDDDTIHFYRRLASIINLGFCNNPHCALQNCLMPYQQLHLQTVRTFQIFETFFPNFSELLSQNIIIDKNAPIQGILARAATLPGVEGFIRNTLETSVDEQVKIPIYQLLLTIAANTRRSTLSSMVRDAMVFINAANATDASGLIDNIDLAIELAILRNLGLPTVNYLRQLKTLGTETINGIDWTVSNREIEIQIEIQNLRENRPYPHPTEFGLRVNELESRLLREHFDVHNAVVVSPAEIRRNLPGFMAFQRALTISIARQEGVDMDPNHLIPFPDNMPRLLDADARTIQERSFRENERLLKEASDWVWLLLYPKVQEKFIENTIFTAVPPYVMRDGKCVPFDPQKNTVSDDGVINHLPFLNYISQKKLSAKTPLSLTIIGEFVKKIIQVGGIAYINHGIFRWLMGTWKDDFNLDPEAYVVFTEDQRKTLPTIDIDMLVVGITDFISSIARRVVDEHYGSGLVTSVIKGRGMNDIDYTFIAKRPSSRFIANNPYLCAHGPECTLQAIRTWPAGGTYVFTNQIIETLIGLSRFRSPGGVPILVRDKQGVERFALKPIDWFGGLLDYVETEGGVIINGKRKNVIRFLDHRKAFPEGQRIALWHALRTVAEKFYTIGGAIILPQGVLTERYEKVDIVKAAERGADQFRQVITRLGKQLNFTVVRKWKDIYKEDMRREVKRNIEGFIETNLPYFLFLCSDEKTNDKENGEYGLELSLLFPHMQVLHNNQELWNTIKTKAITEKKQEGESNLHFFARLIISIPGAMSIIARSIREEFINDPLRVGTKMLWPKEGDEWRYKRLQEYPAKAYWAILDSELLYQMVWHGEQAWVRFLNLINSEGLDIRKSVSDIKAKQRCSTEKALVIYFKRITIEYGIFKRDLSQRYHNRYLVPFSENSGFNDRFSEIRVKALMDWLTDAGF